MTKPNPPDHLSTRSRRFWRSVVGQYELQPHELELLRRACEASDQADRAHEILAAEGLTFMDRYGQAKAHPAAGLEIQNRAAEAKLLAQLGFKEAPSTASQAGIELARKRWRHEAS